MRLHLLLFAVVLALLPVLAACDAGSEKEPPCYWFEEDCREEQFKYTQIDAEPDWSPDGRSIAFVTADSADALRRHRSLKSPRGAPLHPPPDETTSTPSR